MIAEPHLSYCVYLALYLSLRLLSGVSAGCCLCTCSSSCLLDWLLEMGLPEPSLWPWQWWLQKQTNAWIQHEAAIAVSRVSTSPFSTQPSSLCLSPDRSPQTLGFPIHFKVVEGRLGDLRAHLSLCCLSGVEYCMVNRISKTCANTGVLGTQNIMGIYYKESSMITEPLGVASKSDQWPSQCHTIFIIFFVIILGTQWNIVNS